jgi:hypothetical protein
LAFFPREKVDATSLMQYYYYLGGLFGDSVHATT